VEEVWEVAVSAKGTKAVGVPVAWTMPIAQVLTTFNLTICEQKRNRILLIIHVAKTGRLIWLYFANPDTNWTYGNCYTAWQICCVLATAPTRRFDTPSAHATKARVTHCAMDCVDSLVAASDAVARPGCLARRI
jgi:hypothetical protein